MQIIAGDPKRNTPHDDAVFEDKKTGFKCFCQGGPQCHDAGAPEISYNFDDVKKYNCDIIRLEVSPIAFGRQRANLKPWPSIDRLPELLGWGEHRFVS